MPPAARPAGPSPLPADTGTAVEVERVVNGVGLVGHAAARKIAASGTLDPMNRGRTWTASDRTGGLLLAR